MLSEDNFYSLPASATTRPMSKMLNVLFALLGNDFFWTEQKNEIWICESTEETGQCNVDWEYSSNLEMSSPTRSPRSGGCDADDFL